MPQHFLSTTEMTSASHADGLNQSANGILENCVILDVNSTVPWDNSHNLISYQAWSIFDRVKAAYLIPILFLIGAPSNLINLAVFFRQGLQERINLCLFVLALVDLVFLTAIFIAHAERIYTQFTDNHSMGPVFRAMVRHNAVGFFSFAHGSAILSAVISTERCVCVLFPLKAHSCVSSKVFAAIVLCGVLAVSLARLVATAMYSVQCHREVLTGRLSWQLAITDQFFMGQATLRALDGVFYGFCVRLGCPVIVLVTTAVTGVRLTHTVKWRNRTSSSLSSKEMGVAKMLIALSVEFVVLSLPVIIVTVVPLFVPKLSPFGDYANLFRLCSGLAQLSSYTSYSVNFFVYYFVGTKYRETLHGLLRRRVG